MISTPDLDRFLDTWFEADAPARAPSDLVDSIALATSVTRRRPAWMVTGWWLPGTRLPMTAMRIAVAFALAMLLAVAGLLYIGSRPRVPSPFGPAKPGMFVMSLDGHLITMTADRTVRTQLTSGDASDSGAVFSRDGTKLAFWSRPAGAVASDLVVMNADGSNRRMIANATFAGDTGPFNGPQVSWAPDGISVLYGAGLFHAARMYLARTDRSEAVEIGDPALEGHAPTWSPDGSLIAFGGGASDDTRGVYVMAADGTGAHRLTHANAAGFSPTWSPDGRQIAYDIDAGDAKFGLVNVDGSDDRTFTSQAHWYSNLGGASWSPDGSRLAWIDAPSDVSQPSSVIVADSVGEHQHAIPVPGLPRSFVNYDGFCLTWSPDGRSITLIIVAPNRDRVDQLAIVDLDSEKSAIVDARDLMSWDQQRLAP